METYEMIRQLRIERGLSQDELANLVGYKDRSSVAKVEAGKVDLSQSKIALFAKALNVTPAYLLGLEPDEPAISDSKPTPVFGREIDEEATAIANAYKKATPKEQQTVRFVLSDYLREDMPAKKAAARAGIDLENEDFSKVTFLGEGDEVPQ